MTANDTSEVEMTDETKKRDITTQLVHAGERQPPPIGQPVATPIYASATFTYGSMDEIDQVFAGTKDGFIYTRYGNPTVGALEAAMREIEGGAVACAYATGMAAVHAAFSPAISRPVRLCSPRRISTARPRACCTQSFQTSV